MSRYVHLNPVRVRRLGLDKTAQARARAGLTEKPDAQQVRERLERLRRHRWSSCAVYAGWKCAPKRLGPRSMIST